MSIDLPASKEKKPGFRPGVCVKNGKLYAFSQVRVIVVRGWPEISAWTRTWRRPGWSRLRPKIDFREGLIESVRSPHRFWPHLRMGPPFEIEEHPGHAITIDQKKLRESFVGEQRTVLNYFANVPPKVGDAIAPFCSRQWHLHAMASRCAGALDLIMSNPALAFCLASCWVFADSPSRYAMHLARRLIRSRRRKICAALGFPEIESSYSVLSKIPAPECCIPRLWTIRDVLKDPEWRKTLSHLPSLNMAVMQFVGNRLMLRRATPRLLHELSENPHYCLGTEMCAVMKLQKKLGEPGNERFHSTKQFFRLHEELLERSHRLDKSQVAYRDFPEPPIPGSENVVPLKNTDQLYDEGQDQNNCAMSYADDIAGGGIYLYRVLQPERATLSIVPGENGRWQIGQLLRAHNKPVSDSTYQGVAQWLSNAH